MTEKQRKYAYGIATAAAALALFYGLISAESAPLWLGLTGSILGNGLAFANTGTNKPGRHEKGPDDPANG